MILSNARRIMSSMRQFSSLEQINNKLSILLRKNNEVASFSPEDKKMLVVMLDRERDYELSQMKKCTSVDRLSRLGYSLIEGGEGKYNKIVKVVNQYIIEVVFSFHKRKVISNDEYVTSKYRESFTDEFFKNLPTSKETRLPKDPNRGKIDRDLTVIDMYDRQPVNFSVFLTSKRNSTLSFTCSWKSGRVVFDNIGIVKHGGLSFVNAPPTARLKKAYPGPKFYQLSLTLQNHLIALLKECTLVPEIGLWVEQLSLHSEQKEYIQWLEKFRTYISTL